MRWEARSPRLSRLEGPVREVRTRYLAPCYTGVVSFIIERGQGDQDTHFVHPQRDLKTNTPDADSYATNFRYLNTNWAAMDG